MIIAQGVQEVLKGTGKDAYTLRFATEQQAQAWRKGFELIAKVGGILQLQCVFARVTSMLQQLLAHARLQHANVVQQRIAAAKK